MKCLFNKVNTIKYAYFFSLPLTKSPLQQCPALQNNIKKSHVVTTSSRH